MTSAAYFPHLIGQDKVKTTLSMFINGAKRNGFFPPMLFSAPKGFGKTVFCHATAKSLEKPMMQIDCGTIRNSTDFIEQVLLEVENKEMTLFFEEFHEMPEKVASLLLSVLNVTSDSKTHLSHEGYTINFDLTKQTFLFATTEKQKIFAPLQTRLQEIAFEDYSQSDLANVLRIHLNKTDITDEAAAFLTTFNRGNSRDASKLAKTIDMTYAPSEGIELLDLDHAKKLVSILNLYELGLTAEEFRSLRFIVDAGLDGITLGALCAKTGMTRSAQQETELYLQKHGLMFIEQRRKASHEGREYVKRNSR